MSGTLTPYFPQTKKKQ